MTDQRRFPFFVNGRFWRFMDVEKSIIHKGAILISVSTRPEYSQHPAISMTMKHVPFQLAQCGESKHDMVAHWIQGFWVVDSELELDKEGSLYLKDL